MKRKILLLLVTAAVLLSAVACNTENGTDSSVDSAEQGSIIVSDDASKDTSAATAAYTVVLADNGDGTAVIAAILPAGIGSGKIVVSVSEDLSLNEGTLKSAIGGTVNENYNRNGVVGACVAFANLSGGLYDEGAEVFSATYTVAEGAELSVDDITVSEWNLSDGTDWVVNQNNGNVIKKYVPADVAESGVSDNTVALTIPPTAGADSGITLPAQIDEKYINAIKARLDNAPYACALYYVDLETGLSMTYNPDRMFAGASLVKAQYLMMIFEMIEQGKISLDSKYPYLQSNKRGGTTKIPYDHNYGDMLTLKEIIEYVVWHSDNTGFNMLQVHVPCSIYSLGPWAKERYGTTFEYTTCNWLNARGVAECWKEIYHRSVNGDENYAWYVSLLKDANENKFVRGGLPKDASGNAIYEVAHKYGMDINASNDAAIVFYNDRPYFLCILTDYIGINTQSFMNQVSADVFSMHEYICSFDKE